MVMVLTIVALDSAGKVDNSNLGRADLRFGLGLMEMMAMAMVMAMVMVLVIVIIVPEVLRQVGWLRQR
jgi:hypothetical protein